MTALAVVGEIGVLETRQERARRRTDVLRTSAQTIFETLADIYRDEDWRYVNDAGGHPYSGFTAFVCDQLDCSASNARRYQQGITGLVLPLQELAGAGARIPVTSADVARLGVAGARVVVEEAAEALDGVADADGQTVALRALIDSVARRVSEPGFGPVNHAAVPGMSIGSLVPAELPALAAGGGAFRGGDDADRDGAQASGGADRQRPAAAHDGGAAAASPRPAAPGGELAGSPNGAAEAAGPLAGSVIEFGAETSGSETADGRGRGGRAAELEAAIATILDGDDPAAVAQRIPRAAGAQMAADCAAAAQRLARLGQLLRSLT